MAWVTTNVPCFIGRAPDDAPDDAVDMRTAFWDWWKSKQDCPVLVADCPWPVEARFLLACVEDAWPTRNWEGPYPLIDVASVRLAAGLDPLGQGDRLPGELPAHDPLADARQSARLYLEALACSGHGPKR